MNSIAIIGTGHLGSAFAEAAAGRGDSVTVWNRSAAKARALESFGVKVAGTPADAVRGASRVHLILKDDAVVNEVIAGLRPGLGAGAIICDHTTTQPALTAERASRLAAEGVNYLHCPVFMGPPAARKAEGVMMVSGPRALYDRVQVDLAKMTGHLEYFGERADLAAVYKLIGNALVIGVNALMADVLTMAKASSVDAGEAMKLFDFFNPASDLAGRGRRMASGSPAKTFELAMARKDLRLMIETAGGLPLAALPGIAARMDALIAAGYGADGTNVLAKDVLPAR